MANSKYKIRGSEAQLTSDCCCCKSYIWCKVSLHLNEVILALQKCNHGILQCCYQNLPSRVTEWSSHFHPILSPRNSRHYAWFSMSHFILIRILWSRLHKGTMTCPIHGRLGAEFWPLRPNLPLCHTMGESKPWTHSLQCTLNLYNLHPINNFRCSSMALVIHDKCFHFLQNWERAVYKSNNNLFVIYIICILLIHPYAAH